MRSTRVWGYVVVTMLAAAALTLSASAAWAAVLLDLPAGQACSFALEVSGTDTNSIVRHSNNGLIISGGTGSALTFTNLETGKSVSFPSNGAASVIHTNPSDGSFTEELMGHNVVILFPTDNPPGPSTTLVVGRAVIHVDASFNFDVLSVAGTRTDICALLT